MNLSNATIVVSVDEKFKPYLKLLNQNLNKSGVRFELFIITQIQNLDLTFLKPKKVFCDQKKEGSVFLNEVIRKPNNCLVLISEPFLCQENWLKKLIELKESIHNCGSATLPFHSYIDSLELTHALNNDFELSDVYVLKNEQYCGITLFGQEVINLIGGFNPNIDFDSSVLEYISRSKKVGLQNFISFEFATNILPKKNIELKKDNFQIERSIREISAIEEYAYHNLEVFFEKIKLEAEKFMFEFTATFGFRCMCLNQKQILELNDFCIHWNLEYNIKSYFLSSEQRLNKNTYVIFNLKG